jgi:hypothetical protein
MASASNYQGDLWKIDFIATSGHRKAIYLGKVTENQALAFKSKVEALDGAQRMGHPPDNDAMRWVMKLDAKLHAKLVKVGLLQSRESTQLIPFLDRYIAGRTGLDPKTVKKYEDARDKVVEWPEVFQPTTDIRTITQEQADRWVVKLKQSGIADASVRGFCRDLKIMFSAAVDRDLIPKSPFRHLASASIASKLNHYVSLSIALDFLDRCKSLEWRVLFALTRLEGMRHPSDTTGSVESPLTFNCVDWNQSEITFWSPKLDKWRTTPASPLVMAILREARELAADDSAPILQVVENNRDREFKRQLKLLDIKPWPKLFQSLRASCEIQWLMEGHPEFAVTQWLGHSVTVSRKHYANVVPREDYALFHGRASVITNGLAGEEKVAHKAAHYPAETTRNDAQAVLSKKRMNRLSDDDATLCDEMRMSALGLEPRTYGLKVRCSTN